MATATASKPATNGTAPVETVSFPLDSFKDAAKHLRRPFTVAAVKFKVQATWTGGGLIVAYIDARLAIERLNLIVPHLWRDEYEPLGQKHLICKLTVDDITRQDIGEGTGKGLYSDALKRAAVKFGVGVSLYAIPQMRLWEKDGHLKENRGKLELTEVGAGRCRTAYANWLGAHGIESFGEPLNHGDVEDAQGDPEAETPAPTAQSEQAPAPPELPAETVKRVIAAFKAAGTPTDWLRMQLVAIGAENVPEGQIMQSTIQSLTPDQAAKVIEACEEVAAARAKAEAKS